MNKRFIGSIVLMIISINIKAEGFSKSLESTQTVPSYMEKSPKIKSVRSILGELDLLEHTQGQMRLGYITFSGDSARTSAYALGGHYHFNTKRWNGFKIGAESYTVLNLGVNQNALHRNGDFFDAAQNSFILLSQVYLDGKWGNTEIKLGRQILDTPHADSDDIRMMPNYFEAYTLTNTDIDHVTLSAGLIDKMSGWENGVDSSKFVDVGKTLGLNHNSESIFYASATYTGIEDFSLDFWYYHYSDIAHIFYIEAGYSYTFSTDKTFTLGFQYDGGQKAGTSLLGEQSASTYGVSVETEFTDIGLTILAAYNQDNGQTGATGLSLGGGPFFTSMEDQTLDSIGSAGRAWMLGAGYDFETIGLHGLQMGIAYGSFEAKDTSLYNAREIDAVIEYSLSEKLSITAALASVDHKVAKMQDYHQFRLIANYNY